MELATGALGSLLPKLGELLKAEEYGLQTVVKKKIETLSRELEATHAVLRKIGEVPLDQRDQRVRIWMREVKEASYDMEDIVDTFLVLMDDPDEPTEPYMLRHLRKRMSSLFKKSKARHNFSSQIDDFYKKLELAVRQDRYRRSSDVANPVARTIDPRIFNLYISASELVGIERPRDELVNMLSLDDNTKMKVVSIVGFCGLGKTTLARAVYDHIKQNFKWRAFVLVGQNPDMRKVLRDIFISLDKENFGYSKLEVLGEGQLSDELSEFVEEKRCFIVLDDVWDIPSILIPIRHVFKESNKGTRIIVTTRNFQVAIVGEIYRMKPLSDVDSERLLWARISDGEGKYFDRCSADTSDRILRKTGGVPLVIITVASVLAGMPSEDWSFIYDSLFLKANDHVGIMMKILSLSYYDLPFHLRICLLYLCMYPQDHIIKKDKLIWGWIAEGFVSEQPGIAIFKTGESYFHELINRSMIQPVQIEGTDHVYGCWVHDVVVHLIRLLSDEEEFVSVLDGDARIRLLSFSRRLAIRNREAEHILWNVDVSHLRSLNVNGCPMYTVPAISSFSLLRVLDLENCGSMEGYDEHLGKLFHLRFLGLRNTLIHKFSETIGRLRFLQTLDLEGTGVEELPVCMGQHGRLMCLNADWTTRVDKWIEKLTSLEQLVVYPGGGNDQDSARLFVNGLGRLRELRVLRILMKALDEELVIDLLNSLSNLSMMEVLHFDCYGVQLDRGVQLESTGFTLPRHLLELRCFKCSRLPVWLKPQDLPNLCRLWLMVSDVDEQELKILGGLPSLLYLHLLTENTERGDAITSGSSGGFQNLKFFSITKSLKFVYGAMPRLEVLDFHFNMRPRSDANPNSDLDFGLGYLNSLQKVIVQINYLAAFPEDVGKAEEALKDAIHIHPNRPTLEVSSFGQRVKTAKSHPKNLTPKLEKVDKDGLHNISNAAKGKEVEASPSKSNQTRELESISMDVVTKAMRSLVTKLDKLVQEEYSVEDSIRKQAQSLSPKLKSMHRDLSKVADLPSDQVDARVISWAPQVKEASHDMECVMDNFLMPLVERHEPADPDSLKHLLEKMGSLLETGKAFYYSKLDAHDGIDDPIDELIKMLSVEGHNEAYNKKMNIFSIVKSEGLGMKTLAEEAFDKLSPQFDCGAFVVVGQNPDLRKVFTDILIGLDKQNYKSDPMMILDLMELIWLVRKYLINKRFFVVIDDIWDLKAWDIIKCALIENGNGSAVLTTTRRQNLSLRTDDDDKSHLDTKKLFYKKLFGSEDKCPPELKDVCEQLIATCDGILSVVLETVALLASVPLTPKDWQAVCDARKLALSYPELPDHLRKCLLYFSMFRKGYEISRERLVWAWIAEGNFIQQNEGQTLQEVAESYLSELVMRKMVEAVDVDASGKALSCRAYGLVHDFIISKSTEEKFVAILNDSEGRALPDTVHHRLSIQGNTEVNLLSSNWLSKVKSLVVTCDTVPSVSGFPALQVMDLGGCHSLQDGHLKGINNAKPLKYLVIGGNCSVLKDIAKLTDLQTLDLSAIGCNELPKCVLKLSKLVCLRVSSHMKIPDGIEKMTTLQELGDVNIIKPELLKKLCKLVNLRVLRIAIWSWDESLRNSVKQICDNLCSLVRYRGNNIQSLSIMTCSSLDFMDSLEDNWAESLQLLDIKYSAFDALPKWFGPLCNISSLTIEVYELSTDMIVTLGNLPCLGSLSLRSTQLPKGYFVIDSERFKTLSSLKFVSNAMKQMFVSSSATSATNATQQLKRLTIVFQASRTEIVNKDFSFGLENLCSLKHIRVEIICSKASHQMVNNAEAAIRKATSKDGSSHPNLEIRRLEEQSMVAEEVLCDTQAQEEKATKKWQNKKSSNKKIRVTGKIFRQKRRKELLEHISPFLDSTAKPHFLPSHTP